HSHVSGTFLVIGRWPCFDTNYFTVPQGFDFTYDKRLYDRLRDGHAKPVREHLFADIDYQSKMARFLENHDEPRAAASFPEEMHQAAAVITFLSPGLRFFHQGQFEGRLKRISPHLVRAPKESFNESLAKFYDKLLAVLRKPAAKQKWQLLECAPAWDGNSSAENFICYALEDSKGDEQLLVAVNYSSNSGQCYVQMPFANLEGSDWRLQDRISSATYDRNGNELQEKGLYLDMPPWQAHVFTVSKLHQRTAEASDRNLSSLSQK
ncbi:MAG: hypothetical protein K2X29_09505, partial [Candidatus Obscuribacterales bacterium]|nr:hypothetical protein [Candidatus Obscuribacterales bacterium]